MLAAAALLRLVYSLPQPDPGRFWDERYGFRNVAAVLLDGRLGPAHALYPSLSWLPQTALLAASEALHRLTGAEELAIVGDPGERIFSPTAYRLARGVSVVCGVWAVWLLYRLGSRALDPATGLVGALLLAGFWRHVTASGEFKPDAIVVALTLLSAGWSVRAGRLGSWAAYLLAGAGIGLVASAKYNAAVVALVLVAAVAVHGRGAVRLLPRLAAAAAASLAVFGALNPWPALVARDFRWQLGYYALEAERAGSGHGDVLLAEIDFLVRHHGVPVALCAAAGLAALGWRAARSVPRHRELIPLLVFAAGYPLVYAAVTRLFLSQNMLPAVPFTCLFAAWAMVAAGRALAARWPSPWLPVRWRPALGWAAFAALAILVFRFPVAATYDQAVPSTSQRAAALLADGLAPPLDLRIAFHERGADPPIHARIGGRRLRVVPVDDLAAVDPAALDLADVEVFPAERLAGAGAGFYLRRLAASGAARVERLPSRLFVTRGRELVVVLHPWRRRGPEQLLEPGAALEEGAGRRRLSVRLDGPAAPGEAVSLGLTVPYREAGPALEGLTLAGRPLAWYESGGRGGGRVHLITERRRLGEGAQELVIVLPPPPAGAAAPRFELHRWRLEAPEPAGAPP